MASKQLWRWHGITGDGNAQDGMLWAESRALLLMALQQQMVTPLLAPPIHHKQSFNPIKKTSFYICKRRFGYLVKNIHITPFAGIIRIKLCGFRFSYLSLLGTPVIQLNYNITIPYECLAFLKKIWILKYEFYLYKSYLQSLFYVIIFLYRKHRREKWKI